MEVAVSDGGGATRPAATEPTNSAIGGRGLGIVMRLSQRWGFSIGGDLANVGENGRGDSPGREYPGETTVWAELPVRYGSSAGLVTASSRDA